MSRSLNDCVCVCVCERVISGECNVCVEFLCKWMFVCECMSNCV